MKGYLRYKRYEVYFVRSLFERPYTTACGCRFFALCFIGITRLNKYCP